MKWFKHDSTAHTDAKLKKVKHKYGMIGYGLYWYCIELIAFGVDKDNISFELEEDAETIALEWNLDQMKVQEMMGYMVNLGLFEDSSGTVTCLKLAKRLDDTNSKNPQIRAIIDRMNSETLGETPNNSGQTRLDKNRIDNKTPTPAKPKFEECDLDFAQKAYETILARKSDFKKPNLESWAKDVRLMREKDGRNLETMAQVFVWTQNDHFWQSNILSMSKFRKQYDSLSDKALNTGGNANETRQRTDNSAAGRVRAKVAAELAKLEQCAPSEHSEALAIDGEPIRPQMDDGLWR